jgi:hypothetical protein
VAPFESLSMHAARPTHTDPSSADAHASESLACPSNVAPSESFACPSNVAPSESLGCPSNVDPCPILRPPTPPPTTTTTAPATGAVPNAFHCTPAPWSRFAARECAPPFPTLLSVTTSTAANPIVLDDSPPSSTSEQHRHNRAERPPTEGCVVAVVGPHRHRHTTEYAASPLAVKQLAAPPSPSA